MPSAPRVREVAVAVTASTITTVAVFLPLALVTDITGELFRPFALTITIALAASLFVALTIVPVLAYWFLRSPITDVPRAAHAGRAAPRVERAVRPFLRYPVLLHRRSSSSCWSALLVGAGLLAGDVDIAARAGGPVDAGRRCSASRRSSGCGRARRRGDRDRRRASIRLLALASRVDAQRRWAAQGSVAPEVRRADAEDELDRPTRLQRAYLPIIRWTLRAPAVVLVAALLILGGSGFLATKLPTNFISNSGQNTLSVQAVDAGGHQPRGGGLRRPRRSKTRCGDVDGVETVQVSVGSSGNSFAVLLGGGSDTTFSITTDPDADQDALRSKVSDVIDGLDPDEVGDVAVSSGGGGGFSSDIEIEISAPGSGRRCSRPPTTS